MTRRCSHCSNNGHNSRTCPSRGGGGAGSAGAGAGGLKLFGVRLTDGSIIKKSASMGNLSHYHSSSSAAASPNPSSPSGDPLHDPIHVPDGYLSDDPAHACSSNRRTDRKKGVPWTEEEHRMFLIGLQKLGKGDWRGIARNFVMSRTPTQVASHAQKYFIRQSNASRRKRRSSLFDMVPDTASDPPPVPEEPFQPPTVEAIETDNTNPVPSLNLSLNSEFEAMDATSQETVQEAEEIVVPPSQFPTMVPAFFPAYLPVPVPMWPPNIAPNGEEKGTEISHEVLKPIPLMAKEPVNVDELVGMSQLSLGETENTHIEPSPLSLKLLGTPSRPSAFHVNTAVSGSDMSKGKNSAIQAV
ncbi:transcription factor MYBS3 [Malania oleifera]|uniref:transcription factor MYBS3 n=1 Tax=Malania oleifera TaxID=397392 RepID=UPI0025ADB281|nr:transcription factor MYBS3 [Malania oleifera]